MGILRREEGVVFIPGALQGEEVRARLTGVKKGRAAWAELEALVETSPQRRHPGCPHYALCGGCQIAHASYAHQLEIKEATIARALSTVKQKAPDIQKTLRPIIPAPSQTGYRNKAVLAVGQPTQTEADPPQVQIGFYARRSREIAGHGCPLLLSSGVNALLDDLSAWLSRVTLGTLRHILVRESFTTGDLVLILVGSKHPDWLPAFLASFPITSAHSRVSETYRLSGLGWLTSDVKGGSVIEGNAVCLSGSLTSEERLTVHPYLRFSIDPVSFFQINTAQTSALIEEVLSACALTGDEVLWDLYCGTGTISLYLACQAKAVLGIDQNPGAIQDAWHNARRNSALASPGLEQRLCFLAGTAEKLCPSLPKQGFLRETLAQQKALWSVAPGQDSQTNDMAKDTAMDILSSQPPDIIVLDPSARGAKAPVLASMLSAAPGKIVYVSCDPATLARDLRILVDSGDYAIGSIQPIDLFPQTAHVETIATLLRK